jgi:hypothetical protein
MTRKAQRAAIAKCMMEEISEWSLISQLVLTADCWVGLLEEQRSSAAVGENTCRKERVEDFKIHCRISSLQYVGHPSDEQPRDSPLTGDTLDAFAAATNVPPRWFTWPHVTLEQLENAWRWRERMAALTPSE